MIFDDYRSLFNLFNGEQTFTVNIQGHIIELSKEDLETGTCYKEAEDHYHIRIFLTNYKFNLGRVKNGTYENPTALPADARMMPNLPPKLPRFVFCTFKIL